MSRPSARSASILASRRNRRWPGACMRRSRGSGPAIPRAILPARRAARPSASASAAICWWAARPIRSLCNRSASRARSALVSQPGWKASNFGREGSQGRGFVSFSSPTTEEGKKSRCSAATFSGLQNHYRRGSILPADPIKGRAPDEEAAMGQDVRSPRGPRCIALVGPFQSGKTTLLEAILARTGAIPRQGNVEAGSTVGDASAEARHHKMSVELSVATTSFLGDNYTFIDCPGSVEFIHDMRATLPAVDAAVVVCEADEKKVPQLQILLRELEAANIPRFLFLNKIDKADKRIRETLATLQPASRVPLVLRQIPIWNG